MSLRQLRPTTPGTRFAGVMVTGKFKREPEKKLVRVLRKHAGRNNSGKITVRHQGGRQKQFLRLIDWKRDLRGVPGIVVAFEYDPNRSSNLALIKYADGQRRYILAPEELRLGETVVSGPGVDPEPGNALPLAEIPAGMAIHCLEIVAGKGAQLLRAAGSLATIQGFEGKVALVKFPSGEVRRVGAECYATIGQVGNIEWKNMVFGKAGRKRHLGIRPTVRGTAQNPRSHPHGGGEGRSGEGMPPKTPWGRPARGKKTRKKTRFSNRLIVERGRK